MTRKHVVALSTLALIGTVALAQDGPLRRAGRALDNAGKNIRTRVETEVARGQAAASERDLLYRVSRRIDWDKQLAGSALQMEVRPGGVIVLRGSVVNESAKLRTLDLVENTLGVTSIIDELAVLKAARVIEARPAPDAVPAPAATSASGSTVIELSPPVVTPAETKVIVKP